MADARALLRAQKATRRVKHPHATYSASGNLSCQICQISIKSENLWTSHLNSPAHLIRLQRSQGSAPKPPDLGPVTIAELQEGKEDEEATNNGSKKRKLVDAEEEFRKRIKAPAVLPKGFIDEEEEGDNDEGREREHEEVAQRPKIQLWRQPSGQVTNLTSRPSALPSNFFDAKSTPLPVKTPSAAVDLDSELAAFERDIARAASPSPPPDQIPNPRIPSALHAPADISAAPLTAVELAARAREETSVQGKGRREEEIEEEKEEAEQRLEDEFEEMEGLEERVRRLKEMREEIRRRRAEEQMIIDGVGDGEGEIGNGQEGSGVAQDVDDEDEEEDDDDDDDDELDDWGWGR
ncbi:hypothetical protein MMC25_006840 [Agyrium rufum]|nr:hypothetical protein [Agyrium rufum]